MGRRKNKQIEILTNVFSPFNKPTSNSFIENNDLERLSKRSLFKSELEKYDILIIDDSLEFNTSIKNNENELIYEVRNYNECSNKEELTLYTGKYIGKLYFDNKLSIKIDSGYSRSFLTRMINYSNKIYLDKDSNMFNDDSNMEFLLLIEYLFLINLKKSLKFDFPRKYELIKDKGFNIKGNIDIKEYIKDSLGVYKGYPYKHKERIYDINIMSVISKACSLIEKIQLLNNFNDISKYMNNIHYKEYLKYFNSYSINTSLSSPLLNNECYSSYKLVLKYASLIITSSGFNVLENTHKKKDSSIKGYLIDITSLYELYIYSLIRDNFKDYKVTPQYEVKLYEDTFFKRSNFIDILMEKKDSNDVIIIDTKFKRMGFRNEDLDRSDFHQIHAYAMYLKDKGKNVKYAALIYPSTSNHESKCLSGYLSSSKDSLKFGISYINTSGDMSINEREFIQRLRDEIESCK